MALYVLKEQEISLQPLAESRFGLITWPISLNKRLFLYALCVYSVYSVVKFLFVILVAVDFNFEAIALAHRRRAASRPSFLLRV